MTALILGPVTRVVVEFRGDAGEWTELDSRRWDTIQETDWFIARLRRDFPDMEFRAETVTRFDVINAQAL